MAAVQLIAESLNVMRCQIHLVHRPGNAFRAGVVAGIGDPGRIWARLQIQAGRHHGCRLQMNECTNICAGSNASGSIGRFTSSRRAPWDDERFWRQTRLRRYSCRNGVMRIVAMGGRLGAASSCLIMCISLPGGTGCQSAANLHAEMEAVEQ